MANSFGRARFIEKWELKYHSSRCESSQEFWLKNFKGKPKFKISRHKQNSSLIFLEAYWETNEPVLILRSFEVMKPGWTRHHIPLSIEAQLMHSWSWNIISATLDVVEGGDTLEQNHKTLSRRSVLRTRPANSPLDLHLSQTQKTLQLRTWWQNENVYWSPANNLSTHSGPSLLSHSTAGNGLEVVLMNGLGVVLL